MDTINYAKMDDGIKDLVYTLDQIPFITLTEDIICEGHLRDGVSYKLKSDKGFKFIFSGDLGFFVDGFYTNAENFLDEIISLKQKYHFLDLHQHHCEDSCRIEDAYIISLDYSDLTHPESIVDSDDLETRMKKRHQVEISVGQQRIREYKEAWLDILIIAKKYADKKEESGE